MKVFGTLALVLLGAVCLAGFFSGETAPRMGARSVSESCIEAPPAEAMRETAKPMAPFRDGEYLEQKSPYALPAVAAKASLLARVESPDYRRSAELALKVVDCVKAEDELEAKLEKIHGEIVDMLMEGTEGSRRCSLRVLVPSPSFRGFVSELRAMGKVQAEKITASKIKGGAAPAAGEPDARELCLVSVRMMDERVAAAVVEGRGNLASSFDRSASHLLNGLSVLVEGLGYVLPFALAGAALLVPAVLLRRLRRTRAVA